MVQKLTIEKILKYFLGILIFILPWQTIWIIQERFLNRSKWQYGTQGLYAVEIVLWLTVILFSIWFYKKGRGHFSLERFSLTKDRLFLLSLLLFVAYLYVSAFWSPVPDMAIQQAQRVMGALVLFLMLFLGPLRKKEAKLWFTMGAGLQACLGLLQFFLQQTFESVILGMPLHITYEPGTSVIVNEAGRWLRAYGALSHPNIFGGYMVMAIVICTSSYRHFNNAIRKYIPGIFILLVAGLFVSFSRSAWIAFAIYMLYQLYLWRKKKQQIAKYWIFTSIIVMVLLLVVYLPIVQTRILGGSAHEVASTQERIGSVEEALLLFKNHFLLGTGAGNYTAASYILDPGKNGWEYQPVHNIDLLLLVELGVVGLSFCLLAIYYFVDLWLFLVGKRRIWVPLLLILILTPLALFDHYLWTSFTGITMVGAFFGVLLRKDDDLSTGLS